MVLDTRRVGLTLRERGSDVSEPERRVGSVTYKEVGDEYFEQRGLRRHAGVWSLWALGVGAVISGDFYGWNAGLITGGFGGLLIATAVIAVMYYGLCYSIAEMSPALPHTGGAYSFARSAMGPWGGFLTGLAENMEYVITPAVVVAAMGVLMHDIMAGLLDITGDPFWNSEPFWWAVFYVIFVGINIIGIEATMRFTVGITVIALGILAFFYVAALVSGKFDFGLLFNIPDGGGDPLPDGGGPFLPFGISGIFKALPFAIWFYLAIEEVPLAAEESMDPRRDVPKGTIWGMHTLLLASLFTLFINSGVDGGAAGIGSSATPLFDGFKGVFGDGTAAELLGLIGLLGLIASFFTIIYAYGRNTYSLSRAGYFPAFLSKTGGVRKTPYVALIAGAILGYFVVWLVWYLGRKGGDAAGQIVAAVLYMAVFAAVISYTLQCISFILLRRKLPNIARPYVSPWGEAGAMIAGIIAVVSLFSIFLNADYRPGVYGVAVYYVLGVIYFAIAGRHRLVLSPEEEFALTLGERGVPEAAGYRTSREEQEAILRGGTQSSPPPTMPPTVPPSDG
ncbi:MAG: amino acid permease [Actinobacteria bacterium]|nr:amino acid permease [Actinomycetota bacterium]